MAKLKCAILDDYQQVALGMGAWDSLGEWVSVDSLSGPLIGAPETVAARLGGYDIIVAMRERSPFRADLLALLPDLRLLITTGMANAAIDIEAAARRGVLVCGTRGVVGPAAELAWALLLALTRKIPQEAANFRAGGRQWQLTVGLGLQGKTLGMAGLGKLGKLVCGYGKAFGMDVLAWSRPTRQKRATSWASATQRRSTICSPGPMSCRCMSR